MSQNSLKEYTFTFHFPELAAAHAFQVITAAGSSYDVALSRAAKLVRQRPPVKGRRLTKFKITGLLLANIPDTGN